MVMRLSDLEQVEAGTATVTGTCRFCGVDMINGMSACDECAKAPARITISNSAWESGHDVFPAVPEGAEFEYVRADLVEKLK